MGISVVLLGQDRADEANDRAAVGDDIDDVGPALDFSIQALIEFVGPDLPPDLLGERGEREVVRAGSPEVLGDGGKLVLQGGDDSVKLGVRGVGVGPVVDRVALSLDPRPG